MNQMLSLVEHFPQNIISSLIKNILDKTAIMVRFFNLLLRKFINQQNL